MSTQYIGGYEFERGQIITAMARKLIRACGKHGSVLWQFDDGPEAYKTVKQLLRVDREYFDVLMGEHTVYLIDHEREMVNGKTTRK